MQYPVPALVEPEDAFAEQPMWRLATIRPNHPRFKHLPLVKGQPGGVIEVVRGDESWAELLVDHAESDRLFEAPGKTFFVVENRLGNVRLVRTGARTPVGFIELHLYSGPLGLKGVAGCGGVDG